MPVYHLHNSAREYRILQRVEYGSTNLQYLCPTCQDTHPARPEYGLNICVSTSQLHNFHQPREPGVTCSPDPIHVDWLTIPGAVMSDLDYAWRIDYHRQPTPMRILVVAGLNDLIKGGTKGTVMEGIKEFKKVVDENNRYHPGAANQFAVAPLLMPPKLVWYLDNGPPPPRHTNRLRELVELNNEIFEFNAQNGLPNVPHINLLGVRRLKQWNQDGSWRHVVHHRMGQWRETEARNDKLHLKDAMRVRLGKMVMSYFQGEVEREGGAILHY